jgi:hypothetical protein
MCQLDSIFGLLTILGVVVLSLAMDGLARLACDEQLLCGRYKTVVDIASTVPNPSPLGGFPSLSSDQETDCTSINPPMSDPARLKAATAYGLTAAIGLSNAICDPPYDISIESDVCARCVGGGIGGDRGARQTMPNPKTEDHEVP